ncbi:tRNA epoxyqueuosine(34) reductase QueG [Rhizobium sp. L1K21]|uniref:tRNA epoxyqueuosine(34) reductase QueG n=1 Tax=Rhizobium sp. L1K21 TaxID=2954933 RepID=UPI002093B17F|nr:tRNA epoxyqueuosine(34) reductase QueG [Rhizobium sp. L1K21]MCO6187332.1 tRNA epoxyqueuosine(34) reductase QueG [Rhizobium sp. L1K21]
MRTSISSAEKLSGFVKSEAARLGFSACRIAPAVPGSRQAENLAAFLNAGYHGTMAWMKETEERRGNPRALWPEAQSVIVLAMNYGPETDPLAALDQPDCGSISVYARNRDYHDVIKGKLKELAGKLASRAGEGADVKVFVDTAPVMEKPLAQSAGLGWQGKHTNLVSRELGSWFFLGSIFTTAELAADDVEIDHCGTCSACLSACPTNAFPAPYQIDARRCISYLTIEHKGSIAPELRPLMGNRIYGCDDCLAACPWNKFAHAASEMKLAARDDLNAPKLEYLLTLDDAAFRTLFSGSPIKRIGRNRFIRNCLIAAGNSADLELAPHCRRLCRDDSADVRAMAIWALSCLEGLTAEAAKGLLPPGENDPLVLAELQSLEM